jgi:NTP pyrophosphatase (non-canonical NTP hydrolase)
MPTDSLELLRQKIADFAAARDWEQFHSPKNLSMALIAEAAELIEHFQWLTEEQSRRLPPERHAAVGEELADILIYLVRSADVLGINLVEAAHNKMAKNGSRYPVAQAKGNARRASEYQNQTGEAP